MVRPDYTISFDVEKLRSIIEPNDGYCWVYYDPIGMDKKLEENGKIYLKAYERDTHKPIVVEVRNFESSLWHRVTTPDEMARSTMVDAYGRPIVQENFFNAASRKQWLYNFKKRDNYCAHQIVECWDPCDEFMQRVFVKEAQEESFNKAFQRVFFLDIETEMSDTSLMPHLAQDRILMVTIYDNKTEKFYTWSLKKCTPLSGKHIVFDDFGGDEGEMLKHMLYFWTQNYPDVVCGWNSRWYDMPYIVKRIENVLGAAKARFISPLEDYRLVHEIQRDSDGNAVKDKNGKRIELPEIEYVEIKGLFQADEMLLYRNKFAVKQALDGGYGLSNVGMAEGLGSKVHHEGLKNLYETDWPKFYEYNVRDVELLWEIEKKCKLIPLARTVVGFGLANYDYIYQSAPYLVPCINIFSLKHREGMIFNTYANNFIKKCSYEGAWVIPPTPGRYSYGIACCDYNSLYPSAMRMMNLSIETYVGRILDGYEDELDEFGNPKKGGLDNDWFRHGGLDGYPEDHKFKFMVDRCDMDKPIVKEIDAKTLRKLLDTKLIICPTNMTFFLKHEVKRGVIADWAEVFFNRRKATKKEMFKVKEAAKAETDPAKKEALMTRYENLYNLQYAIKIVLNSIYGALGTTGCPFLHPIGLAQSVTRAGRFCNSNGVKFYRQWLEENYNVPEDYVTVASGDTDSVVYDTEIDVIEDDAG